MSLKKKISVQNVLGNTKRSNRSLINGQSGNSRLVPEPTQHGTDRGFCPAGATWGQLRSRTHARAQGGHRGAEQTAPED